MEEILKFKDEVSSIILNQGSNTRLKKTGVEFMNQATISKYSYTFSWMGRPIIQYPQDMIATQELIWEVKPDLIIETGIAHGGSLIYYASILELIGHGEVLGIDIDIREHNRREIEAHKMSKRIQMIQGSSISKEIAEEVYKVAHGKKKIMVFLDSNHTHEHVLEELKLYAPLVTLNSYCIVFDTIIEDVPPNTYTDRPWDVGNNPKTAVYEFLATDDSFQIDKNINDKLIISVANDGYLKRIK